MLSHSNAVDPALYGDGVDHIRVAPDAATSLGQALHIGTYRPFIDPQYGKFASLIAFWYWYDGNRSDALRGLHHTNMVRSSFAGLNNQPGNRSEVIKVARRSILSDRSLVQDLRESTLPLKAYEVLHFSERENPTIYPLPDREWYIRGLEEIRRELQQTV